jgi:pyridine nucleotide-disulfide oxidoreductase family protein
MAAPAPVAGLAGRAAAAAAPPPPPPPPSRLSVRALFLRIALECGVLALFARHAFTDGVRAARGSPLAYVRWLNELRILIALERARRIDVLEAGGEAAVAADPARMFARPLPHLAQLRQLSAMLPSWRKARVRSAAGAMGGAPTPVLKELVLVGGGHSHVHVLRMWGMAPVPGVRLTLVTRDIETPYSGMLPGHVAGAYTRDECHLDLVRLCAWAGARLIHAEATGLDLDAKRVRLAAGRPPLRYDVLSINIGCTPRLFGNSSGFESATRKGAGADARGVTAVKPIDGFGRRWDALLARTVANSADGAPTTVAIVGGGGGGVELALAVRARLVRELRARGQADAEGALRVLLVGRSAELMPRHAPEVRSAVRAALESRGIRALLGAEVVAVEDAAAAGGAVGNGAAHGAPARELVLADGQRVGVDESIWCTEGAPQGWLADSGLALDAAGFLEVDTALRVGGRDDVFAAGDVASIRGHPRPKAGVFAVRMGPPLVANLNAALRGAPLARYEPQAAFLGLIGTGEGGCIASRGSLALEADWLWRLKDWIDRKWMHAYGDGLPHMADASGAPPAADVAAVAASAGAEAIALLAAAPMRCGGCGAKVGSTVLSNALARVALPTRRELLVGVDGGADDCAVWEEEAGGAVSVQTVDYLRGLVSDPYDFGLIGAQHALSDCFAMGAQPTLALAFVTLPLQVRAQHQGRACSARDRAPRTPRVPHARPARPARARPTHLAARAPPSAPRAPAPLPSSSSSVVIFPRARPSAPRAPVPLPSSAPSPVRQVAASSEDDLVQMMAGASAALREAGCALGGGHTSEGAEAGIGFAITGRAASASALLRKGGLREGDALIVTKPLGTGVLFAAQMRGKARGRWIAGALRAMRQSNGPAAAIVRAHGASGCTDVTGFGLCGHLLEMCKASGRRANLELDAVPTLDGTRARGAARAPASRP